MADNLFLKIDFGLTPSTDNGNRPYQGAQPLWSNTSIFLSGGVSPSETKVGMPTTVKVRVSNRMSEVSVEDVKVDAYVMNPFVGAFVPANAVVTLSSQLATITPGSGAPSDADPHVLECKVAGPNGPEAWTPTSGQLANTTDGHFCLVANCYADGDGAAVPAGAPFDVTNNRHQGQRNIHVLAAMNFGPNLLPFFVMPFREGAEAVLELQPAVPGRLDPLDEQFLAMHPAVTVRGEGSDRTIGVTTRDGEFIPIKAADRPLQARVVLKGGRDHDGHDHDGHDHDGHDHDEHDHDEHDHDEHDHDEHDRRGNGHGHGHGDGGIVPLPPLRRPRRAMLQLDEPLREDPGTRVDIVQRTAKGELLGGLRVLTLMTA